MTALSEKSRKPATQDSFPTIQTEILIQASQAVVWDILTDFRAYGEWNPFIIKIEGKLEVGERLKTHMQTEARVQVFSPVVTELEGGQSFEWRGSLPLGLFKGKHSFRLEDLGQDRCRLIHGESFSGLLSKSIMKRIGEETLRNFEAMNEALKVRAEKANS